MTQERQEITLQPDTIQALRYAAEAADNTMGLDIRAYDVSQFNPLIGGTLIASGTNPRQVLAIAENVENALNEKMHIKPKSREGLDTADWILLDYGDFVIHAMNSQTRAFYALEELWDQCPQVDLVLKNRAKK